MLQEGWMMVGDENGIIMKQNGKEVQNDIVIRTSKGALYCGYFQCTGEETAAAEVCAPIQLNINHVHQVLRHCNENSTQRTAKYLGWQIMHGWMEKCKDFALAKACQRNVPKEGTGMKATVPNGQ